MALGAWRSRMIGRLGRTVVSVTDRIDDDGAAPADLAEELKRLRAENARLLRLLNLTRREAAPPGPAQTGFFEAPPGAVHAGSPPEEKVAFFGALFAARTDIYAVRWDNARTGQKGWLPAVRGGWRKGVRHAERDYLPLTAEVLAAHLSGQMHVGLYPLLDRDRCWWLAADFDGSAAMPPGPTHGRSSELVSPTRSCCAAEWAPKPGLRPWPSCSPTRQDRPAVIATGPYIGEGFDCPALDTLFLAAPIAFKGRLVQYAGLDPRAYPEKATAEILNDYPDPQSEYSAASLAKRAPGYISLGFRDPRRLPRTPSAHHSPDLQATSLESEKEHQNSSH